MDPQLLGILGTALSALIASLKYRAKVKHDTLRSTKATLFYLLEIRHHISKLHEINATFTEEYMSYVNQALAKQGIRFSETEQNVLAEMCKPLFREFATPHIDSALSDLIPPYCQTLTELAKDDPLLAFNLKGKESFGKIIKSVMDHIDQVETESKPDVSTEMNSSLRSDFEGMFTEFALDELTTAVKRVALRCGLFTYIRCLFIVNKSIKLDPVDVSRLDKFLQNGLQRLTSPQEAAPTSSSSAV